MDEFPPEDTDARNALSIRSLSKRFGATQALDGVTFDVQANSVHALIGGNGSGKSTLIKILAGVHQADEGYVCVGPRQIDADRLTPSLSWDLGLRFVHQQRSTFGDMTVAENLAIGSNFLTGGAKRIKWRKQQEKARELLDRFDIRATPNMELRQLSPANQTMVAIARALQDSNDATSGILVLDEPTASLPRHEVDLLLESLRRYATRGQTIIYVSHRLEEIREIADSVTVLRDGHLVSTIQGGGSHREMVELMTGREVGALQRREREPERNKKVLEVKDLKSGAVKGVDFSVYAGEILGIAGLLGSGRSSVLRAIFGEVPVDSGQLLLDGESISLRHPRDARQAGIAHVPEDRERMAAFPQLSILENLGMADTQKYFAGGHLRHRRERQDAKTLIEDFRVKASSVDHPLGSLSGGNAQKVILARWLRRSPRVVLLDEPTQGVDVGARFDIWNLVKGAVSTGMAAIVVSSDFEELAGVCDRVLVMANGRVQAELTGSGVTERNIDQQTLMGGVSDEL